MESSVDLNNINGIGGLRYETDLRPFDSVGGSVAESLAENREVVMPNSFII